MQAVMKHIDVAAGQAARSSDAVFVPSRVTGQSKRSPRRLVA